jgi:hypothetical protein
MDSHQEQPNQEQPEPPVKPAWRRVAEVLVPVALFAAGAPLLVNGIASAINSSSTQKQAMTASPIDTVASVTTLGELITADPSGLPDQKEIIAAQIIASVATTPEVPQSGTTTTVAAGGHSHGGVTPEQPLTRTERQQLATELTQAREAALRYPTVADALADGYSMVTTYLPLIGAHYIKFGAMDGKFDINQPEMLLYDGTDPASRIVGLSYYVFSDSVPSPFTGPNDVWHQHIGLCLKDGVVVGGEATTVEECTKRGGVKAGANNGYMVHAWVVAGWDSPQGVFSPEHIGLTKDLPTS